MTTDERRTFLEGRQEGMGGSDMPRILGLVPKTNSLDIYHEKTRPLRDEDLEEENIHQMRGHRFEPMAREQFWARTGWKGRDRKTIVTHPDYPAFRCNLDFDIFKDTDREWLGEPAPEWMLGTGVGETKCPISYIYGKVIENGLRQPEMVQAQTYAAVARRAWACLNYFNMEHKDGPTRVIPQQADPAMGKFLLEAGQRFWDEHVVPRIPPDPSEWELLAREDAPVLLEMSGELQVIEDEKLEGMGARVLDLKDIKKETEVAYEEFRDAMEAAVEATGHRRIQLPKLSGSRFTIVQSDGRESFSRARLEGHRPIDRDKFEKWVQDHTMYTREEMALAMPGLELDLSRFVSRGDPSQHLRPTRGKDV